VPNKPLLGSSSYLSCALTMRPGRVGNGTLRLMTHLPSSYIRSLFNPKKSLLANTMTCTQSCRNCLKAQTKQLWTALSKYSVLSSADLQSTVYVSDITLFAEHMQSIISADMTVRQFVDVLYGQLLLKVSPTFDSFKTTIWLSAALSLLPQHDAIFYFH
jgi:hypothetical protein